MKPLAILSAVLPVLALASEESDELIHAQRRQMCGDKEVLCCRMVAPQRNFMVSRILGMLRMSVPDQDSLVGLDCSAIMMPGYYW